MAKKFWLMKSEADVFSIDDLERDGSTYWDGVRNYQARNIKRGMRLSVQPVDEKHFDEICRMAEPG